MTQSRSQADEIRPSDGTNPPGKMYLSNHGSVWLFDSSDPMVWCSITPSPDSRSLQRSKKVLRLRGPTCSIIPIDTIRSKRPCTSR